MGTKYTWGTVGDLAAQQPVAQNRPETMWTTARTFAKQIAEQPTDSYRQILATPKALKWTVGMPASTSGEMLANVYSFSRANPVKASEALALFNACKSDPTSQYFDNYAKPTNKTVLTLQNAGYDTSSLTSDWFSQNTAWQNDLIYNGTTNTPTKPGKKATTAQNNAYALYQIYNSLGQTEKAKQEFNAAKEEVAYWTGRTDLNLSDDEILAKLDFDKKYPTLKKMDDTRKAPNPLELNEAIGYDMDTLRGVIWSVRNGRGAFSSDTNTANYYMGVGKKYEKDAKIAAMLDAGNLDTYDRYAVGSTMDTEGLYFGRASFDQEWIDANRSKYVGSGDATAEKMFSNVVVAERQTQKLESELAKMRTSIDNLLIYYDDPETVKNLIKEDTQFSDLFKLDQSLQDGKLVDTTRAIDYRWQDVEKYIENKCADKDRVNNIISSVLKVTEVMNPATPVTVAPEDVEIDAVSMAQSRNESKYLNAKPVSSINAGKAGTVAGGKNTNPTVNTSGVTGNNVSIPVESSGVNAGSAGTVGGAVGGTNTNPTVNTSGVTGNTVNIPTGSAEINAGSPGTVGSTAGSTATNPTVNATGAAGTGVKIPETGSPIINVGNIDLKGQPVGGTSAEPTVNTSGVTDNAVNIPTGSPDLGAINPKSIDKPAGETGEQTININGIVVPFSAPPSEAPEQFDAEAAANKSLQEAVEANRRKNIDATAPIILTAGTPIEKLIYGTAKTTSDDWAAEQINLARAPMEVSLKRFAELLEKQTVTDYMPLVREVNAYEDKQSELKGVQERLETVNARIAEYDDRIAVSQGFNETDVEWATKVLQVLPNWNTLTAQITSGDPEEQFQAYKEIYYLGQEYSIFPREERFEMMDSLSQSQRIFGSDLNTILQENPKLVGLTRAAASGDMSSIQPLSEEDSEYYNGFKQEQAELQAEATTLQGEVDAGKAAYNDAKAKQNALRERYWQHGMLSGDINLQLLGDLEVAAQAASQYTTYNWSSTTAWEDAEASGEYTPQELKTKATSMVNQGMNVVAQLERALGYSQMVGYTQEEVHNIEQQIKVIKADIKTAGYYLERKNADFDEVAEAAMAQGVPEGVSDLTRQNINALLTNDAGGFFDMLGTQYIGTNAAFLNQATRPGLPTSMRYGTFEEMLKTITEDEKKQYFYELATNGEDAANDYFVHLVNPEYGMILTRMQTEAADTARARTEAGGLSTVLGYAESFVANAYGNMQGWMFQKIDRSLGREINPYGAEYSATIDAEALREGTQKRLKAMFGEDNLAVDIIYNAVTSGIDSAITMLATRGMIGAAAKAIPAIEKISGFMQTVANGGFGKVAQVTGNALINVAGAMPMSAGASMSTYRNLVLRGVSPEQREALYTITFLAESISEGITFGNMRKLGDMGEAAAGMSAFVKELFKSGFEEAVGEGFNQWWEDTGEQQILGDQMSQWGQIVTRYMEAGMPRSVAENMADQAMLQNIIVAAASGFLSSMGTAGISYGTGRISGRENRYQQMLDAETKRQTAQEASVLTEVTDYLNTIGDTTGATIAVSGVLRAGVQVGENTHGGMNGKVANAAAQQLTGNVAQGNSIVAADTVRGLLVAAKPGDVAGVKNAVAFGALTSGRTNNVLLEIAGKARNGQEITATDVTNLIEAEKFDHASPQAATLDGEMQKHVLESRIASKVRDTLAQGPAAKEFSFVQAQHINAMLNQEQAWRRRAEAKAQFDAAKETLTAAVDEHLKNPIPASNAPVQQAANALDGADIALGQEEQSVAKAEEQVKAANKKVEEAAENILSEARQQATAEVEQEVLAEQQAAAEAAEQAAVQQQLHNDAVQAYHPAIPFSRTITVPTVNGTDVALTGVYNRDGDVTVYSTDNGYITSDELNRFPPEALEVYDPDANPGRGNRFQGANIAHPKIWLPHSLQATLEDGSVVDLVGFTGLDNMGDTYAIIDSNGNQYWDWELEAVKDPFTGATNASMLNDFATDLGVFNLGTVHFDEDHRQQQQEVTPNVGETGERLAGQPGQPVGSGNISDAGAGVRGQPEVVSGGQESQTGYIRPEPGRVSERLLSREATKALKDKGVTDLKVQEETDPGRFSAALSDAKANNTHGAYVDAQTPESLQEKGAILITSKNGLAGAAVGTVGQDAGNIFGVFKNARSRARNASASLIINAISEGGNKLDCFNGNLSTMYARTGMIPVARVTFNEEYMPDGWNLERDGKPDVIFWMHNGDTAETVARKYKLAEEDGGYHIYTTEELAALPIFDDVTENGETQYGYDRAWAYRDQLLADRMAAAEQTVTEPTVNPAPEQTVTEPTVNPAPEQTVTEPTVVTEEAITEPTEEELIEEREKEITTEAANAPITEQKMPRGLRRFAHPVPAVDWSVSSNNGANGYVAAVGYLYDPHVGIHIITNDGRAIHISHFDGGTRSQNTLATVQAFDWMYENIDQGNPMPERTVTTPTVNTETQTAPEQTVTAPTVNTRPEIQRAQANPAPNSNPAPAPNPAPVPNQNQNQPYKKPRNSPMKIAKKLAHDLHIGAYIGTSRFGGGRKEATTLGYYDPWSKQLSVRPKEAGRLSTTMHEVGHAIADRYGFTATNNMVANLIADPNFNSSAYPATALKDEALAEFFRRYMTNEQEARKFAGDAYYDNFESKLYASPDGEAVRLAREQIQEWLVGNTEDRIMATIRNRSERPNTPLKSLFRQAMDGMVDSTFAAEEFLGELRKREGSNDVPLNMDVRKYARMVNTSSKRAFNVLTENLTDANGTIIGPSLKDAIEATGFNAKDGNYERLLAYWLAKHSLSRDEQNKPVFDIDGMDREVFVADIERNHKDVVKALKAITEFHHDFMQAWMVDTGFLTQEAFDKMSTMYPFYAPTARVKSKDGVPQRTGKSQTFKIRRAKGSTEDIYNPMDSYFGMVDTIVKAVAVNNAALAFDRAYQTYEGLGNFAREVLPGDTVEVSPTESLREQEIRDILTGKVSTDTLNEVLAAAIRNGGFDQGATSSFNTLRVRRPDGKTVEYEFDDMELFKLLSNASNKQSDAIWDAIGLVTRSMSALTTGSNPIFAFRNLMRDYQSSVNYGSWAANYLSGSWKWLKTFADVWRDADWVQEYKAQGGGGWTMVDPSRKATSYELNSEVFKGYNTSNVGRTAKWLGKKIWNGVTLAKLNEVVEQTSRAVEYKYGKHDRTTPEGRMDAFLASQDVTVDFNRSGNMGVATVLKKLIPFFNASMQGVARTGRTFTEGERSRLAPRLVKTVVNGMLASALASGLLLKNMDDDDKEEFAMLSKDLKSKHLYLPNFAPEVFGDAPLLRIPLAQDPLLYAVHGATTEAIWSGEDVGPVLDMASIANTILDNLNPFGSGTIFEPIIGVKANESWYGSRIVPSYLEDMAQSDQYTEETPELAKWLGRVFNYSPMKLQYLAEQYTGFLGQIVLPAINPKNTDAMQAVNAVLGAVRRRFTSDPLISNDVVGAMYDGASLLDNVVSESNRGIPLNVLRRGLTIEEAGNAYTEAKNLMATNGTVGNAKKQISALYDQIDAVNARTDLTDHEKYLQTSGIRKEIIQYAMAANEAIGAYKEKYVTGENILTHMLSEGSDSYKPTPAETMPDTFKADEKEPYMQRAMEVYNTKTENGESNPGIALPHPSKDNELTDISGNKIEFTIPDDEWDEYVGVYQAAYRDYINTKGSGWDALSYDKKKTLLSNAHGAGNKAIRKLYANKNQIPIK